ncbi:MAG: PilZ domain-containing protein [Candidatus Omnitrophica bacterium]|nr:PilZ domain-containing protein [Candidatus Omnitrophota bacterium]
MLIFFEILFIVLLASILLLIFKHDGFSTKNRFRRAKMEECWSGKERRRHPRFIQSLEISYSIAKKCLTDRLIGKTVDISEGGAKLFLDEKLPQGTSIILKILLPESNNVAEIAGDVVWTEDAPDVKEPSDKRFFYAGVRFSSMKEPFGKKFIDYIRSIAPSQES